LKKADLCEFSPSGAKAPPILAAYVRAKARTLPTSLAACVRAKARTPPTFSLLSKNDPNAITLT